MTDVLNAEDSAGATEAEVNTEENMSDENPSTDDDGLEESLYEIGDLKATEKEISEWKKAHERKKSQDADYTRKSQANAKERDQIKADRIRLDESLSLITELENEIYEMSIADLKNIDMEELRTVDTAEYLRVKDLKEQRGQWKQAAQKKLHAIREKIASEEVAKLKKMHGWDDSEKYNADVKAVNRWKEETGISEQSFNNILDAHVITAILESAKYRELMKNKPSITKRVVQAPKISKPSASVQSKPLSLAERMYGKAK